MADNIVNVFRDWLFETVDLLFEPLKVAHSVPVWPSDNSDGDALALWTKDVLPKLVDWAGEIGATQRLVCEMLSSAELSAALEIALTEHRRQPSVEWVGPYGAMRREFPSYIAVVNAMADDALAAVSGFLEVDKIDRGERGLDPADYVAEESRIRYWYSRVDETRLRNGLLFEIGRLRIHLPAVLERQNLRHSEPSKEVSPLPPVTRLEIVEMVRNAGGHYGGSAIDKWTRLKGDRKFPEPVNSSRPKRFAFRDVQAWLEIHKGLSIKHPNQADGTGS